MPINVSYILQPVTVSDVSQVVIRPGQVAGEIIVTAYFNVKDELGVVREQGSNADNLTGAAKTNLINWLNANSIPSFNTARGL